VENNNLSKFFALLVGMRFCGNVPNSTKNKNMKSLNPELLQKMESLASKTLMSPFDTWKKLLNQL
jgi:hypothetical protein